MASQIVVTYLNIYYIVVLAWAILYLYYAFHSPAPWSTCDNSWNTSNAFLRSRSKKKKKKVQCSEISALFPTAPTPDSCHYFTDVLANPHLYQPNSSWAFLNNFTVDDYSDDYTM